MKKLIFTLVILLLSNENLKSQTHEAELLIHNRSLDSLLVRVIPVGFVFNGNKEYTPRSQYFSDLRIFGGFKRLHRNTSPLDPLYQSFLLNHDILFPSNPIDSSIGYGRYLVQFWRFELDDSDNFELILRDSLSIDFSDSDYPYSNVFTGFQNDFIVRYYAVDSIIVDFADTYLMKLDTTDRSFEIWNQYASNHIKPQNKIGFSSNQEFCSYPLDARDYGAFDHVGPGLNSLSIEIKNNAFLSNIVSYPTRMSILGGTTLMVDSNKTLDITESVSSNDTSYFELNLSSDSRLMLNAYSQIIVRNNSRLTMNHNSLLYLDTNAAISVMAGGLLCNYGASIRGSGKIVYKGGVHQLMCATVADFLLQDSSKFVLDSSAVLSIPNSTTLHLKGNETALILNPGSKLLFGENSGIVCDSGARIVANDATFASADSTKKWNGISLNDLASDTIRKIQFT